LQITCFEIQRTRLENRKCQREFELFYVLSYVEFCHFGFVTYNLYKLVDERKSFKKENINVILEFHVRIKVSIVTMELHIYIKYNLWLVALWRRAYQHTHAK
jgi:hypothetical protein